MRNSRQQNLERIVQVGPRVVIKFLDLQVAWIDRAAGIVVQVGGAARKVIGVVAAGRAAGVIVGARGREGRKANVQRNIETQKSRRSFVWLLARREVAVG